MEIGADGNSGRVLEKNKILYEQTAGGHSAVFHANGKDVWVLAHALESDAFLAFLITENGIMPPVVTNIGRTLRLNFLAYLKFSPTGKRVATLEYDDSSSHFNTCPFSNA